MSGWVPMSAAVRAGIDRIRAVNPAIGEWPLFPVPRATVEIPQGEMPKAWTRHHGHHARKVLERAERLAKLSKVEGGDFHPNRRKWSTERNTCQTSTLTAAGAWGATRALKQSYQQSHEATMYAVMSDTTKLRNRQDDDAGKRR
jgi:hypothetical protein